MKKFLFVFYSLLFSLSVFAQDDSSQYIISRKSYSVEDGLASREVFCGVQDHDGFMWFGTRNGLNRFDGRHFKLYTKQNDGLAENRIIQLAVDRSNRLYIVYGHPGYSRSAMKVEVMDLKTHRVKLLKEMFPNLPFDERYVYWIANGNGGINFLVSKPFQYWLLDDKGFHLKCEMKAWDNIANSPSDLLTSWGSYHTTTGRYCCFQNGYAVLYLTNERTVYYLTPQHVFQCDSSRIHGMIGLTKRHELYMTSLKGIDKIGVDGKLTIGVKTFKPPLKAGLYEIYFRRNNSANWLAYSNVDGLYLYDFFTWRKLMNIEELKFSSGEGLYGMYEDRDHNYWIFTAAQLIKIKIKKNPFRHYFTKAQLGSKSENQVRGLYVDSFNNLYANVWMQLIKNNPNTQRNEVYDKNDIKYAICEANHSIFIGRKNKMDEFNLLNSSHQLLINDGSLPELWTVNSFKPNILLIGCSDTLFTFNLISKKRGFIQNASSDIPRVSFVYRFIQRKDHKIWIVAQNGLFLLNEDMNQIELCYSKSNKSPSKQFPFEIILDAYQDDDGIFWFATSGEGLYRWDMNRNQFQQFNITAGLPSDILYRIESDRYGYLWISSDNGLIRFNRNTFRVTNYNTSNGLTHNEFNRISSYKAPNGDLYFGGLDGVNAFNPSDFIGDSTESNIPLQIISFTKFSADKEALVDATSELIQNKMIRLEPQEKLMNLQFQLLDYSDGILNYAYKIDGLDKNWNYINENSIRLSGLPYGEYNLRIKGQTSGGEWSKQELSIPILVLAPFYKKWWVIASFLLVSFIVILTITRWRTTQLVRRKNELERTIAQRTDQLKSSLAEKEVLLKEIHHRVKNNLQVVISLLNLQQNKLQSEEFTKSIVEAKSKVRSISLIHENLYRHENLSGVEFKTFVHDLFQQVDDVFNPKKEEVIFVEKMDEHVIDIDTAVPLGLILNELFTNSYKYARTDLNILKIEISLNRSDNEVYHLTYSDNGPGLVRQDSLSGGNTMGMNLMKDLCRQIGGKIVYKEGDGATFEINFISAESRKSID